MGARGLVPHTGDRDAGRGWGMRRGSPRVGRGALVPPALAPRENEALAAASSFSGDVSGKEEATTAWGTKGRGDRWAGAALGAIMTP